MAYNVPNQITEEKSYAQTENVSTLLQNNVHRRQNANTEGALGLLAHTRMFTSRLRASLVTHRSHLFTLGSVRCFSGLTSVSRGTFPFGNACVLFGKIVCNNLNPLCTSIFGHFFESEFLIWWTIITSSPTNPLRYWMIGPPLWLCFIG